MPRTTITATPDARAAIAEVVKVHGPIMFHTSGGRVGGREFPICLPKGDLRIGARDHLLGEVEGVPIYEMDDREGGVVCRASDYVLDVVEGRAIGFSLAAGPGRLFTLNTLTKAAVDETG